MRIADRVRLVDVRVVLVMPYEGIRQGLTLLLEGMRGLEVVAQSGSGPEGLDLVRHHEPDIVVLDAEPDRTVRAIAEIRKASPDSRLVVTVNDATLADVEASYPAELDRHVHAVYPGQLLPTIRELLRQRKAARD